MITVDMSAKLHCESQR